MIQTGDFSRFLFKLQHTKIQIRSPILIIFVFRNKLINKNCTVLQPSPCGNDNELNYCFHASKLPFSSIKKNRPFFSLGNWNFPGCWEYRYKIHRVTILIFIESYIQNMVGICHVPLKS